jgi:hypothetical protein
MLAADEPNVEVGKNFSTVASAFDASCSRFCVACNSPDTYCTGNCRGTIEKGALRLGKTPRDVDGDWVATSWIHW